MQPCPFPQQGWHRDVRSPKETLGRSLSLSLPVNLEEVTPASWGHFEVCVKPPPSGQGACAAVSLTVVWAHLLLGVPSPPAHRSHSKSRR